MSASSHLTGAGVPSAFWLACHHLLLVRRAVLPKLCTRHFMEESASAVGAAGASASMSAADDDLDAILARDLEGIEFSDDDDESESAFGALPDVSNDDFRLEDVLRRAEEEYSSQQPGSEIAALEAALADSANSAIEAFAVDVSDLHEMTASVVMPQPREEAASSESAAAAADDPAEESAEEAEEPWWVAERREQWAAEAQRDEERRLAAEAAEAERQAAEEAQQQAEAEAAALEARLAAEAVQLEAERGRGAPANASRSSGASSGRAAAERERGGGGGGGRGGASREARGARGQAARA